MRSSISLLTSLFAAAATVSSSSNPSHDLIRRQLAENCIIPEYTSGWSVNAATAYSTPIFAAPRPRGSTSGDHSLQRVYNVDPW